jgi:hypothetical protein
MATILWNGWLGNPGVWKHRYVRIPYFDIPINGRSYPTASSKAICPSQTYSVPHSFPFSLRVIAQITNTPKVVPDDGQSGVAQT